MTKTKILLLALMSGGAAYGATETPAQYKLECWDRTFSYNRLDVEKKGGAYHFMASGQSIAIFKNLVKLDKSENWGELKVAFSVPENQCLISETDQKLLFCTTDSLNIAVRGQANSRRIDEKTVHREVWIKTKRVETMSDVNLAVTGYELDIKSGFHRTDPVLSQSYHHGMASDQTNFCQVKL